MRNSALKNKIISYFNKGIFDGLPRVSLHITLQVKMCKMTAADISENAGTIIFLLNIMSLLINLILYRNNIFR